MISTDPTPIPLPESPGSSLITMPSTFLVTVLAHNLRGVVSLYARPHLGGMSELKQPRNKI